MILRESWGSTVSSRVDVLIVRYHNGDRGLAAHRLGLKPELLTGLLSGDWSQFSLDAFAAVIRMHGVTIDWLLGSTGGAGDAGVQRHRDPQGFNIEPERPS